MQELFSSHPEFVSLPTVKLFTDFCNEQIVNELLKACCIIHRARFTDIDEVDEGRLLKQLVLSISLPLLSICACSQQWMFAPVCDNNDRSSIA